MDLSLPRDFQGGPDQSDRLVDHPPADTSVIVLRGCNRAREAATHVGCYRILIGDLEQFISFLFLACVQEHAGGSRLHVMGACRLTQVRFH